MKPLPKRYYASFKIDCIPHSSVARWVAIQRHGARNIFVTSLNFYTRIAGEAVKKDCEFSKFAYIDFACVLVAINKTVS